MINKIKNIIVLILALTIIFCSFGSISVFADDELPINIGISVSQSAEKNGVYLGSLIRPAITLDFTNEVIIEANGIFYMQFGFRYDPEILELVDPDTLETIEFDSERKPLSGNLYKFDEIGVEKRLEVNMNKDMKTLVLSYGAMAMNGTEDIFERGDFVHFAFRVKDDIAVENMTDTVFEIVSPHIACKNENVTIEAIGEKKAVKINPPFKASITGDYKQNTDLVLNIQEFVDENSEFPLTMTISKDDEIYEEVDIPVSAKIYSDRIYLDEAKYEPGTYMLNLTHNNASLSKAFEVKKKDEPVVTPEPVEPDEGDEDDKKNEDSSDDNTGSDSSNTGTNTGTNTGSTSGAGTSSNTGNATKPNTDTSKDTENKDTYKPAVKYPSDITSHWAIDNVKYVYDNSLMNGYEDGTFGPDNSITRAEFVTVMARLLGLSEDADSAAHFVDASSHWAKGYIGALAANGIVGGVSDAEFAPDENITREQIAAILSRAFALTEAEEFAKYADDAQISDWAYDSVYKVFAAGYMKGDTNNNFAPLASATRAEVATIIYRLHSAK